MQLLTGSRFWASYYVISKKARTYYNTETEERKLQNSNKYYEKMTGGLQYLKFAQNLLHNSKVVILYAYHM